MIDHDKRPPDRTVTEYEDQKPGRPPRPATEPAGGGSGGGGRTQTNPATGEDTGPSDRPEKV